MERFLQKVQSITKRIGDPLNPKSSMGTVIHAKQVARIDHLLSNRSQSAKIVLGGHKLAGKSTLDSFDLSSGSFYAPTVVTDVEVEDELWQEEIFGPVIVVKRFATEDEGIRLANASRYGLGAGVWTSDLSRAHRAAQEIDAGVVWVNTHHRNDPSSPWGGMKDSGIGRENGIEAYESYSQSKSTIINISSASDTRTTDDWFAEDEDMNRRYG